MYFYLLFLLFWLHCSSFTLRGQEKYDKLNLKENLFRKVGFNMINNEYVTFTIGKKKNIALIAHDNEKPKLIQWCKENYDILKKHNLYGTGTTSRLIADKAGLCIKGYNSGPLGGDQQIGAKIVEGVIDFIVFFSDPLTAQPHDPDVKALMRIAQVYDIPMAVNKATADFMIKSIYMDT